MPRPSLWSSPGAGGRAVFGEKEEDLDACHWERRRPRRHLLRLLRRRRSLWRASLQRRVGIARTRERPARGFVPRTTLRRRARPLSEERVDEWREDLLQRGRTFSHSFEKQLDRFLESRNRVVDIDDRDPLLALCVPFSCALRIARDFFVMRRHPRATPSNQRGRKPGGIITPGGRENPQRRK